MERASFEPFSKGGSSISRLFGDKLVAILRKKADSVGHLGSSAMKNRVSGDPHAFPLSGDLRPGNTVLLVIDMQHDFCSESRVHAPARRAVERPAGADRAHPARARGGARRQLHVLHTREGYRSDLADLQPWKRGGGRNDAIAIGDAGPMGRALIRGEPWLGDHLRACAGAR